jgi:hypothetical protein
MEPGWPGQLTVYTPKTAPAANPTASRLSATFLIASNDPGTDKGGISPVGAEMQAIATGWTRSNRLSLS